MKLLSDFVRLIFGCQKKTESLLVQSHWLTLLMIISVVKLFSVLG